jgi:hypothetical protein
MEEFALNHFQTKFAAFFKTLRGEVTLSGWDETKLAFRSDALGHIEAEFTVANNGFKISGGLITEVGYLTNFARAFAPQA